MAVNYNIIDIPIDTALDNRALSGGKTYLILLEAHPSANVRIRLNDNTADQIPLDTNYGLKFEKATQIYLTADAVAGESIKIGVSDTSRGAFEVLPSPTVDAIETVAEVTELAGISTALNTALDKIINPYQNAVLSIGQSNSTSTATVINKTLLCDKIIVNLSYGNDTSSNYQSGALVRLDGVLVGGLFSGTGGNYLTDRLELEDVKGKVLTIVIDVGNSSIYMGYALQEFTLKT